MAKRRHTPEQVINKLREAEVAIAAGGTVAEVDSLHFSAKLPLASTANNPPLHFKG